ncbi:recombinase family protein [Nonomuraea sp. JJY05]|uniref:recombinase family protein n=1 Tax=Nonomuraea sp. JJY05 TaxID=3350255 RepID=UPI00373ECFEB
MAEHLRAAGIGLQFLSGELQGSHDPSGVAFTVLAALSGMEREYIRDRTLEGHESARNRGKTIGGATVTDESMLSMALHLRGQNLSLRDIAARLVITRGKKKGQHPSPATVLRLLRDHGEADRRSAARGL